MPTKAKRLSHPRKAKRNSHKVAKIRGSNSRSKNLHVGGRVSNKKARKLEKKQNFARQRALEKIMEEAGEVRMTDAPTVTPKKDPKLGTAVVQDKMEVDEVS
ncbi:hypothetical protein GP486_003070 [Trichoglossum hirsutum]|uniref:Uncharacterized protein n=1 Tax=Trichoglossum hirsutum TaxID=265104 RepID=A0A9P8LDS5_9PEZI|nr:hypothetical protein GP486_003070 [Trichoglossum hirsutum]